MYLQILTVDSDSYARALNALKDKSKRALAKGLLTEAEADQDAYDTMRLAWLKGERTEPKGGMFDAAAAISRAQAAELAR